MAGRRSWAEGHWWLGAKRNYLAVLVLLAMLVFGLHILTLRQLVAPPLQQYYIKAYRTSCTVVRRPLVLPYVQRSNGGRTLASIGDVVVLPPSRVGALRLALSTAATDAGARRVDFLSMSQDGADRTCASLEAQIQANRSPAWPTRVPPQLLEALGLGIVARVQHAPIWPVSGRAMRAATLCEAPSW